MIEGRWANGKLGDERVHLYYITDSYGIKKGFWYVSGDKLPTSVPATTNFNVMEPDYDTGITNLILNAASWGCFGYAYYRYRNF